MRTVTTFERCRRSMSIGPGTSAAASGVTTGSAGAGAEAGTAEGATLVLLIKEIGTDALFALKRVLARSGEAQGLARVEAFYRNCRDKDLAMAVAQTDVKGDRSKRPSEQSDPDLYVRVVEKRSDGIIVSGAGGGADVRGIGLACIMVLAISLMTVAMRRHRETSMVAAASVSNFLGCLVSIPFAQGIVAVTPADLGILAMFGLFQVGLGLTFFTIGSRHLPAAQSSLIGMLETPLMVFWVWLGFGEIPSTRALIGGALVIGAVIADILADSRTHAGDASAKAVAKSLSPCTE